MVHVLKKALRYFAAICVLVLLQNTIWVLAVKAIVPKALESQQISNALERGTVLIYQGFLPATAVTIQNIVLSACRFRLRRALAGRD